MLYINIKVVNSTFSSHKDIMFTQIFIFLCIQLVAISATSTTTESMQPIPCDLSKRTESCPHGYCCARDEFLPEYVVCKKYGKIYSSCATVEDPSVCPCEKGLKCIPNVNSASFVSIYGKCLPITTTVPTTITTTGISTTHVPTTKQLPISTVKHNSPPLIHLHEKVAKIYRFSDKNQKVTSFTVIDNDSGKNGEVQCSVLQSPYFTIRKVDERTFELVLASSLRTLAPQTIPTFIICEDSGSPKLNGLVQLSIQIVNTKPVLISSSTVATPTNSMTLSLKPSIATSTPSSLEMTSSTTKLMSSLSFKMTSSSMASTSTDTIRALSSLKEESSKMLF